MNIPRLQSERSKIFYSGNNVNTGEYCWSSANGVRAKMELLRETFVCFGSGSTMRFMERGRKKRRERF